MSLKPTERDVLRDLRQSGDNIQSNIRDNTGRSMKSVGSALDSLESEGLIHDKGRGVWTLTDDGRDLADRLEQLDDAL